MRTATFVEGLESRIVLCAECGNKVLAQVWFVTECPHDGEVKQ